MAGISESYSARAMLDSHMINISREGMASLEAQRSPETEYKLRKVTEKFLESLHVMLNEPSVGLFRIQEHVRRSVPQLVDKKNEMQSFHQKVEGMCYDVEYSIKTVKSMHNIQHFTIIQECLKSAMASKQNLDKARLDRKNKKAEQETASSSASDQPEIIEEEGTEVQGFICPNCMQLWDNQDELLGHWTSSHDVSDDRTDSAANPEEEFAEKNEQIQNQESKAELDEFAHVTVAESTSKDGSEPHRDSQGGQEQD